MYIIYTYVDPEYLFRIFNAIAMINQSSKIISVIYGMMLVIAFLIASYKLGINQELKKPLMMIGWVAIIMGFLTTQNATVKIKNVGNPLSQKVVNHIPLPLALIASGASHIGYYGTKLFELAFSSIDGYSTYEKTGLLFGSHLVLEASTLRIKDPDFKENMEKFVQQCVIFDALSERNYTLKDLKETNDIWALVSTNPSRVFGIKYKTGKDKEFKNCAQTARILESRWKPEISFATGFLHKIFFPTTSLQRQEILRYLPISDSLISDSMSNASRILKQEIMINTFHDATETKLSALGGESAIYTKSMLSMYNSFINFGKMASKNLPLMKSIFEAVIYGAFFIIVLFMLLPNGYKYAVSYAGILLWIQTWPIFFAIINMILQTAIFLSNNTEDITLLNHHSILSTHDMMIAMSGYLSFLTPYLSYIIIKGGAQSFVHLASTFANPAQSATMQAAGEVTSGNMSLGNLSMGNQNMHNFSAFKHNANLSHMGGDMSVKNQNGITENTTPKGGTTYNADISHLRGGHNLSQDMGTSLNESMTDAKNYHDTASTNLGNSKQSLQQQAIATISDRAQFYSNDVNYQKALGTDCNKSLLEGYRAIGTYAEDNGISINTATQHALEGRVGVGLPSISPLELGATASSRTEAGANRHDSINEYINNELTKDYGENVSNFLSHVKQDNFNTGNTETNSRNESFQASYDETKHWSQEVGHSKERLHVMSQVHEKINSKHFGSNQDLTDEMIAFGSKEFNMPKSKMVDFINHSNLDNPLALSKMSDIKSAFQEQMIDNQMIENKSNFNESQWQEKSEQDGGEVIKEHYDATREGILNKASNEGLDTEINRDVKSDVETAYVANAQKLQSSEGQLKSDYRDRKTNFNENKNNSTFIKSAEEAAKNMGLKKR